MGTRQESEQRVLAAAREQGISSVVFRNAIGRKLGLNITDSECLSFLAIKGTATPKELSQYTGLTTGSTTAMLDRLEEAAYISRSPNPNDRRGTLVKIEKKWFTVAGPLVAGIQKSHTTLLSQYSKEELAIIADFLIGFTRNVEEQTKIIIKS